MSFITEITKSFVILILLSTNISICYGLETAVSKFGSARIMGGERTEPNEIPYQASVYFLNWFKCSGTIVSDNFVLVSGNCGILSNSTEAFVVVGGDYSLRNSDGTEQSIKVDEVIVHPGFNSMRATNDVALLRTKDKFNITDWLQPIRLAKTGQQASGVGSVTGWGATEENGPTSDILLRINITIISDEDCRNYYDAHEIVDSMLCAGSPNDGMDVCSGDAGSPLVCTDELGKYLCGITSWGRRCDKYPAVFTEISYYYNWICQHVNDCLE